MSERIVVTVSEKFLSWSKDLEQEIIGLYNRLVVKGFVSPRLINKDTLGNSLKMDLDYDEHEEQGIETVWFNFSVREGQTSMTLMAIPSETITEGLLDEAFVKFLLETTRNRLQNELAETEPKIKYSSNTSKNLN